MASGEDYIGSVTCFAGVFAPRSMAYCRGQLLNISTYSSLYSIVGTFYGGDGRQTFGVPDMRGRTAVGTDKAPRLRDVLLGERRGLELTSVPLPKHNHVAEVDVVSTHYPVDGNINTPLGSVSDNANLNISSTTFGGTASVSGTAPVTGTTPVTLDGFLSVNKNNGASPVPQPDGAIAQATLGGNPVNMFDAAKSSNDVSGGFVRVSGDVPATGKTVDGSGFSVDTSGLNVSVAGYAETQGLAVNIPPSDFDLSATVPEGNFTALVHDSGDDEAKVETIPPQLGLNWVITIEGLYPPRP